jgi:hypothetical protein
MIGVLKGFETPRLLGGLMLLVSLLAYGCGSDSGSGTPTTGGGAGTGGGKGGATAGSGGSAAGGKGGATASGGAVGTGGGAMGMGGTGGVASSSCDGDTFGYKGNTYTEATSAAYPRWCDPWVIGNFNPNGISPSTTPTISLNLHWGINPTFYDNWVSVGLNGPAPTSFPATYTLDNGTTEAPGTGYFFVTLNDFSTWCDVTGTLTLIRFDAVGGKIEGSYSASSEVSSPTCANPTTLPPSSFSITREPDM